MTTAKGIMAIERGIMSSLAREKLLELQGHECAICGAREKLVLDHDHSNGQVRGFLCSKCNVKIGHVERKEYVDISDSNYNSILDYLHHPPVSRTRQIVFLGPVKNLDTNSYPPEIKKAIRESPDYMNGDEFVEFFLKLRRTFRSKD